MIFWRGTLRLKYGSEKIQIIKTKLFIYIIISDSRWQKHTLPTAHNREKFKKQNQFLSEKMQLHTIFPRWKFCSPHFPEKEKSKGKGKFNPSWSETTILHPNSRSPLSMEVPTVAPIRVPTRFETVLFSNETLTAILTLQTNQVNHLLIGLIAAADGTIQTEATTARGGCSLAFHFAAFIYSTVWFFSLF